MGGLFDWSGCHLAKPTLWGRESSTEGNHCSHRRGTGTAAFLIGMVIFVADMFFAWRRRRRNRAAKINVSVFE